MRGYAHASYTFNNFEAYYKLNDLDGWDHVTYLIGDKSRVEKDMKAESSYCFVTFL